MPSRTVREYSFVVLSPSVCGTCVAALENEPGGWPGAPSFEWAIIASRLHGHAAYWPSGLKALAMLKSHVFPLQSSIHRQPSRTCPGCPQALMATWACSCGRFRPPSLWESGERHNAAICQTRVLGTQRHNRRKIRIMSSLSASVIFPVRLLLSQTGLGKK